MPTNIMYCKDIFVKCKMVSVLHNSVMNLSLTRPMHWRTDANLYPPKRQLTKASEPSFDLEGGAQGQI